MGNGEREMFRLVLLAGYLVGMVQTAYIVGRIYGMDIRNYGSGNAGMTNVSRVLGMKPGLTVFAIDILKAVLVYALVAWLLHPLAALWAVAGVILGHNFPAILRFRGGKGVACTIGLILVLDWRVALLVLALALVVIVFTRYVSLTSIFIMLATPPVLILAGHIAETVIMMAALGLLSIALHHENIIRLIRGKEKRIGH
jgi:glycerol-3-phosphate acyltransferase PlsY